MRAVLTFIGTIGAFLFFTSGAGAVVLDASSNKVVLREFSIDATGTDVKKNIHCSQSEIENGLWNLISFDKSKDNSLRDLIPTYRPLDNQAAWYIDNNKCSSLAPYLNGIGLDSYDSKSGNAVIYLAAFNKKPIDQDEWNKSGDNGYSKMQLMFQPEFDVINVLKYPAKCELAYPSLSSKLGLSDPELACTLSDSKGLVRFAIRKS